jgi:hypothetical protein
MGIQFDYQWNLDIWWVCQSDRIFVDSSYYLDQDYSKSLTLGWYCLSTKVFAWYIYRNGIENKYTINTKHHQRTCIKKCGTLIRDTSLKYTKEKDNTRPTHVHTMMFLHNHMNRFKQFGLHGIYINSSNRGWRNSTKTSPVHDEGL